jgi:thioredoxin 1
MEDLMTVIYIVIGVVVLFFLFQYAMIFKMRFKKGKPVPELSGNFQQAVKNHEKVLFYFYSPNCGACRPMTPVIEEFKKKEKNYFSIDVSKDFETARKFGIMATPSTVVVEKGTIKEFLVGPQSKDRLVSVMAPAA